MVIQENQNQESESCFGLGFDSIPHNDSFHKFKNNVSAQKRFFPDDAREDK
jgi:hypothetical protein